MKRIIIILIVSIPLLAIAQKCKIQDVPTEVLVTFNKKTGDTIKDAKWEKKDNYYEAFFKIGKINAEVEIKATGEWLKTSWEMSLDFLPSKIKEYIEKNYPKAKIKEFEIEYLPNNNFYIISIKHEGKDIDLKFNTSAEYQGEEKD